MVQSCYNRDQLNELWTETAKLKSNGSLSRVPADVLSRLIQILDTYVKKGNNIRILEEEEERVRSPRHPNISIESSLLCSLLTSFM
jgi:hypothetical protein